MTQKFRCTVQYDGTAFAGFQYQPGCKTVQGELEAAIGRVTQEKVRVIGAGRTDAGVHALGQVIHFSSDTRLPAHTLQKAVNACLPAQIAVMDLVEAVEDFHARTAATAREYRYVVDNGPVASPLLVGRAHHVGQALALDAIGDAAQSLIGRHDFAAFGSPMEHSRVDENGERATWRGGTVRTLLVARCWRVRRLVLFCFVADAFLRRMVRMMVGTLLRVGSGSLAARALRGLLEGDRSYWAGPAAPAHGLYLVRVRY